MAAAAAYGSVEHNGVMAKGGHHGEALNGVTISNGVSIIMKQLAAA